MRKNLANRLQRYTNMSQLVSVYKEACLALGFRSKAWPQLVPGNKSIMVLDTDFKIIHSGGKPVVVHTTATGLPTYERVFFMAQQKDYDGIVEMFELNQIAYVIIYETRIEIVPHYTFFIKTKRVNRVVLFVYPDRIERHVEFVAHAVDCSAFDGAKDNAGFPIYDLRPYKPIEPSSAFMGSPLV